MATCRFLSTTSFDLVARSRLVCQTSDQAGDRTTNKLMTYTASITFTAANGKQGRRQFIVTNPADILRCGMHLAHAVGGNNVKIVGWKAWS